jgi:hypothetical protein
MRYQNIREEELKNKVGSDFFSNFDTPKILRNVDFCVTHKSKNSKHFFLNDLNQARITKYRFVFGFAPSPFGRAGERLEFSEKLLIFSMQLANFGSSIINNPKLM